MYQDQDSIKVFERMHARDQLVECARKLGKADEPSLDVFSAHASGGARDGLVTDVLLVAVTVAFLLGGVIWSVS